MSHSYCQVQRVSYHDRHLKRPRVRVPAGFPQLVLESGQSGAMWTVSQPTYLWSARCEPVDSHATCAAVAVRVNVL
jgi:hypothetical protein